MRIEIRDHTYMRIEICELSSTLWSWNLFKWYIWNLENNGSQKLDMGKWYPIKKLEEEKKWNGDGDKRRKRRWILSEFKKW